MGYTPYEEELDGPIEALEEALKKARETMINRIRANKYTEQHVAKLTELVTDLTHLEVKLIKVRQ
jgi:hypothetical protein